MTNPIDEPVAIIGSACRFPGDSNTPSKLWDLLKAPRDLLQSVPVERFDAGAFYHPNSKHHGATNVRHSYFLNEDPTAFDNGFFNIPAGEADAIDPQQRMLMETVYDSLCAAGQTIEGLRGSSTAVYVGLMCDDWSGMLARDMEVFPQYGATGMARSIMSNRISYFFDWHGPSMTIDTACSSSLVAVHQAIQTLRSGESQVAIAAGANLILTPAMYIAESKLSMLSPSGRSRMWDADVDGYARGEGLASVVLKPLSAAIRDNDHIECVIRATGVNQDGRTPGVTMPSAAAQAALIRSTYARTGLDINHPDGRPQFFQAHGTGTPAGDPQEAEAIASAFYSGGGCEDTLYVGSIKTIIGHTEGTAGLASLIGTSLAMQHGVIPPNMHFQTLNPRITPFYQHLEVPTSARPWPDPRPGQPRRASINSFGFGGTNAHAILEAYSPTAVHPITSPSFTPLTLSAASEASLRAMVSSYSDYLKANPGVSIHDLAYTLHTRRSTLAYRVSVSASSIDDVCTQLDAIGSDPGSHGLSTRRSSKGSPKILAVFTGQGSQWPRMGARLLEQSPLVAQRLADLDQALLETSEPPSWTLKEMILAEEATSRIGEAVISQPLCTAIQIILVDLLRLAGIELHAVVGHSSGEIGAAYAAGLHTAYDAIQIAYYRGLYAKLASSPSGRAAGAMMAVGTTFEDATGLCELETFQGRIQVAARNSPSSMTLSGDEDAIVEAIGIFKDEGKFARRLKVDTAYHSAHVLPCVPPYLAAITDCTSKQPGQGTPRWYSSVREGTLMTADKLAPQYWADNMTSPVIFAPAAAAAWRACGPFDLILEVGPHPVLKTPCLDTLEEITGRRLPYVGLLGRGKDDVFEFSNAMGFIWTHLGQGTVAFDKLAQGMAQSMAPARVLPDLPSYHFDHSRRFLSMSRLSGLHRSLDAPPHPLLGKRCRDRETSRSVHWRNILHPDELRWLHGHKIQGQIVFPAAGYIAMAVEAITILAENASISLISLHNVHLSRAMAFNDDGGMEILVDLTITHQTKSEIEVQFSCSSGSPRDPRSKMLLNASGTVIVILAESSSNQLLGLVPDKFRTSEVAVGRFYDFLSRLGYNYSEPFHGTVSIRRRGGFATGTLEDQSGNGWEDQLLVHPGLLDTALQTTFAAFCCPGDERLWALHVPTRFQSIVINPYFTTLGAGKQRTFQYVSVARDYQRGQGITEVSLLTVEEGHTFLQIEGMHILPFSPPSPANDAVLYSRFDYQVASVHGERAAAGTRFSREDLNIALDSERIAFYYLRRLVETVTLEEKTNTLPHYRHLIEWAAHVVPQVSRGENPHIPQSAQHDTQMDIDVLLKRHYDRSDVRLLESVGNNLPQVIRDRSNILEYMTQDGLLDDVYEQGFGLPFVNEYIANMTSQLAHRYPRMNILEIGAGTGGSTRRILPQLGSAFSSYTYTDISGAFFEAAKDRFQDYATRMTFKTFDMNRPPAAQGFMEGTYDLVIACNVLHATHDLEEMMACVRRLLKPGGYLMALETVNNTSLRAGLSMGSLPGWWLGVETGRRWGPTLTLPQWDTLLKRNGFGGIDTATPPVHQILPGHIFCAQAVDDRVAMLRSPLAEMGNMPTTKAVQLVIIGGETLPVHRVCEQLVEILASRFTQTIRIPSIESLTSMGLVDGSTVLSLIEMEDPVFAAMTAAKLDALKMLWRHGGNILWVTTGARAQNPHCSMTVGLTRCMRFEYPNITLQTIDVDGMSDWTTKVIAEHLLRLELLARWSRDLRPGELMWSLEPELHLEEGFTMIPRLYPYAAGNARYNTGRRLVHQQVNPQEAAVLFTSDHHDRWEIQIPSPLRISASAPFPTDTRLLRVTHFFLSTVSVVSGCRLLVCIGVDTSSHETVVALSHIAQSPVAVPSAWCIPLRDADPGYALGVVSARLISRVIMNELRIGETLVLHDPPALVAAALKPLAEAESIGLHITTSSRENILRGWQYLNRNLPERVIRGRLPCRIDRFIDFTPYSQGGPSTARQGVGRCVPRGCDVLDTSYCFGTTTYLKDPVSPSEVARALHLAVSGINALAGSSPGLPTVELISLDDITPDVATGRFAIADCTMGSITAAVSPVDEGNIFRPGCTYLLVGLAGELGQSLCQWMVAHRARYIVLTSRHPKVDPIFIQKLKDAGAMVEIMTMDVTSGDSLTECYEAITSSMPPIAGVANGAMVLDDTLFENMSYDALTKVLRPKVVGSQLLDELFHDTPLDFFILFSSTTAVMGNSGQSNYVAGNMFMNALVAQRKRRGVAASSIDISSIIGLGYVERAEGLSEDTFLKLGFKPMSEQDLQQLFAEAIIVGQPGSTGGCELATGVSPIYRDAQASDQYLTDVKFGHFLMDRPDTSTQNSKTSLVAIRVQLAKVHSIPEAVGAIKDAFLIRLRRILAVSTEEAIDETVTLVEQGVDSLMAVEVRSWFLKELDIDVPVLRILGGSTITDLVEEALKLMPPTILDVARLDQAPQKLSTPSPWLDSPSHQKESITERMSAGASSSTDGMPGTPPSSLGDGEPSTPLQDEEKLIMPSSPTIRSTPIVEGGPKRHLECVDEEVYSPISFGQAGFWFLNEMIGTNKPFNMAVMLKMRGSINVERLEAAVRIVGDRHEILRTRFFESTESSLRTPVQAIKPTSTLRLRRQQVLSEPEAEEELDRYHNETWDLASGDCVKITLLSLSNTVHFLLMGMHHILFDGYSFSVFFKDLEKAYQLETLPFLEPESQYRHFASQQRQMHEKGQLQPMIEHYRRSLVVDSQPIDPLPFARSATRRAMNSYSQHEASIRVEPRLVEKLRPLARRNRATTFHVYLTALQALLFRLLPGTGDINIGIADANRGDKDFMGSIGFFLNLLPIRVHRPSSGTTVSSLIQSSRDTAYTALRYSQLPFDVLLRELSVPRSNAHTPLFQVFLDYRQVVQERSTWGDCTLMGETWRNASTGYDIALEINENITTETLICLRLRDSLYSKENTDLLLRCYIAVLESLVNGPDQAVADISVWSSGDTQAALRVGRSPPFETTWPATISHRIDDMIKAHGSTTALKDDNGAILTYGQLDSRVRAFQHALQRAGVTTGSIVGVFQEPSVDWICSLIAILRAGAAYVPLDLRNSLRRLARIVHVARPDVIMTDRTTSSQLAAISAHDPIELLVTGLTDIPGRTKSQQNHARPTSAAVILFTSGSTGEPKGVKLDHGNIATHVEVASRTFSSSAVDLMVLQQSPFSFDFSLDQIFAALANGGCLYIVSARHRGDPIEITKTMVAERVTYTTATPYEYTMWLRYGSSNLSRCDAWVYALSGGESPSHALAQQFATLNLPGLHLYNGYGPAEATILTTKIELEYAHPEFPDPIPAGLILPGYSACIVDAQLQPVPLGVPGEIIIGGPGVGSGYLKNEQATMQKFLPDVYFGTSGRIFRTGDSGRLLADRTLLLDGRLDGDTQVKILGSRVELTEVEATLLRQASGALSHAVVTVRGEGEARYLVAHVVFSPDYPEDNQERLIRTLHRDLPLPPYMQPAVIAPITEIPRTSHLKIDRKAIQALPLPENRNVPEASRALTEAEGRLRELWDAVIPVRSEPLTADSDFFLVGGNSILLVELQAMLRKNLSVATSLATLMQGTTLGAMAAALEAGLVHTGIDWDTEIYLPRAPERRLPRAVVSPRKTEGFTVLLTGSNGYLGRHVLAELVQNPRIVRIIAPVRQHDDSPARPEKVMALRADLSLPRLGLSLDAFAAVAADIDVIIQCAANRSFWDHYEVLRSDNVTAVKELVQLAALNGIPLHFLSSGSVDAYMSRGECPPLDGSDGYVATKWAAEKVLDQAATALNVPVYIHRPTRTPSPSLPDPDTRQLLLRELLSLVHRLGTQPVFDRVCGSVDLVPTDRVVRSICQATESSLLVEDPGSTVQILRHPGVLTVSVEEFAALLQREEGLETLPGIPILDWFGQAKRAGFSFFMTAQHLLMSSPEGVVTSRR